MLTNEDINKNLDAFFSGTYTVTEGRVIPEVGDLVFGKVGKELDACMLFIDIRESTKIVDNVKRVTAARMYKSFLWGVAKIAKENGGELRSFNGDGVLIVFIGDNKRTSACKAALQMNWFCKFKLKPKLDTIFRANGGLVEEDIQFDYGIGIDRGKILVVRGGMRGDNNNDLVWVGNATNYSVKLSNLAGGDKNIWITEDVYKNMDDSSKFGGDPKRDIWERHTWTSDNSIIYSSNWWWPL